MTSRLIVVGFSVWVFGAAAGAVFAEDDKAQEKSETTTLPRTRSEAEEAPVEARTDGLPVYVPPNRGAKRRRVGAATRGAKIALAPVAWAPSHVGLTTRAQPTLYWSIGEDAPGHVEVTLAREDSEAALLTSQAGARAGVHALALADHEVSLEVGPVYDFVATWISDPRRPGQDRVVRAAIERVEASEALKAELSASTEPAYSVYARYGIWFDALDDVSERIAARPADVALRAARASLLRHVERGDAARWDLEAAIP